MKNNKLSLISEGANKNMPNYFAKSRTEMLEFIPKKCDRILEIGGGAGEFAKLVASSRKTLEIWGVDPNISVTSDTAYTKIFKQNIDDVESQIESSYFDLIIMNDVIEHIYNTDKLLSICHRLLRDKNSYIVCSIPNFRYFHNLKEIIVDKDFKYKTDGILDETHVRFFTKKSILRVFEKNKFEVTVINGINETKSIYFKIIKIIFPMFKDMGYLQYAVIAKNK